MQIMTISAIREKHPPIRAGGEMGRLMLKSLQTRYVVPLQFLK